MSHFRHDLSHPGPGRALPKAILGAVLAAALVWAPTLAPAQPPPLSTVIQAPAGARGGRNQVNFPHQRHARGPCLRCHHTWDGRSPVTRCSSTGCHDLAAPHCPEERQSPKYFRTVFHSGPRSCLGCHQACTAQGGPAGPLQCRACHGR